MFPGYNCFVWPQLWRNSVSLTGFCPLFSLLYQMTEGTFDQLADPLPRQNRESFMFCDARDHLRCSGGLGTARLHQPRLCQTIGIIFNQCPLKSSHHHRTNILAWSMLQHQWLLNKSSRMQECSGYNPPNGYQLSRLQTCSRDQKNNEKQE